MVRIYLLASLCLVALGATMGWMLKPERSQPVSVQAETKQQEVKVVTRTVIKTVKPDGTVTERTVENTRSDNVSIKRQNIDTSPKSQYRVGVQTDLNLRYTATAGRRLIGNLWLDSTFKPSTKDLTLGFSYEF